MTDDNIWRDELPSADDKPWQNGTRSVRVGRGEILAATLHELPPHGRGGPLHFHHGNEEMLIVLHGRPTLRTPKGERQLDEGEVVVFRRGPEDAHKCSNDTDAPVRYLMVSNNASPDAVEYPEDGLLSVMAYTRDQFGKPLWDMRQVTAPKRED
ncbi:MAG TPA: cupin domain-containing protein [Caulobacteraceae bacterium]|nr:cupin domain-containing protein [Caulobacteraceae bacterium]